MFNFKNYPELKKYHIEEKKLMKSLYKNEKKESSQKDLQSFKETYTELIKFEKVYAKKIYNILNDQKPLLHNYIDGRHEEWDIVLKKNKSEPLSWLVSLVEENGGRYRLPAEYYVQKK